MARSKGKGGGRRVVDARADSDGGITHVRIEGNSNFTPVKRAIEMADRGELSNAHTVRPKTPGRSAYLRTNPDNKKGNNLDDLAGDN